MFQVRQGAVRKLQGPTVPATAVATVSFSLANASSVSSTPRFFGSLLSFEDSLVKDISSALNVSVQVQVRNSATSVSLKIAGNKAVETGMQKCA